MQEIATSPRRPRGRPQRRPDDETLRLIIEAARDAFLSLSFGDVSMVSMARRAGVSTKTMYRLVPTKADLFRKVVAARIEQFVLELDVGALDALPLADALTRILTVQGSLTLGADATALYRLAVTERDRFPEIAKFFFENAIEPAGRVLEIWLRKQCERGTIKLADPKLSSGMLRGMLIMDPQRAVLLGQRPLPDAAEIAARARTCAEFFLDGCRA